MAQTEKQGDILYSWEAQEFVHTPRNASWYVGAGVIALLAVAYAVYVRQWIFLIVVVMAGVVVYLLERTVPRKVRYQLSDEGVTIANRFHGYGNLKSFWVASRAEGKTVNLVPIRRVSLLLTLQLADADVEQIRKILSDFLPEESAREDDYVDRIGKWLKF